MDTIRDRWAEDFSTPLLVNAPRRSGKTTLVCELAAEHLEMWARVCVVVTCERLVRCMNLADPRCDHADPRCDQDAY